MAFIEDATRANRLARAIGADILLYNDEKFKSGCSDKNPFLLLPEELVEGYLLYKTRVTPELCANFAASILSIVGGRVLEYNIAPDTLLQHLARALGTHAKEAGALQNIVHDVTPEPIKKPSVPAPLLAPKPPTPIDNVTRVKVKRGSFSEDGDLLLFSSGFGFESSSGNREEYLLASIQDIKIDRSFGGEIQLRVEVSYQEHLFTLTSVAELTKIVLHLLPAFGKS
jgi:hypothetical protein